MKEQRYFVVMSTEQEEFYSSVNDYLSDGWELQGGIFVSGNGDCLLFMQAITITAEMKNISPPLTINPNP